MVKILKDSVAVCDKCKKFLSYQDEDLHSDWNWRHTRQTLYILYPNCGNDISIGIDNYG